MQELPTDNPIGEDALGDLPEDFEVEETEDGGARVFPKEQDEIVTTDDLADFYDNLAASDTIKQSVLDALATEYIEYIEKDKQARKKREEQYADALRRSGLGDDAPGGADFDGASRVVHPLLAEAAVDFSSRAIKELFPSTGAVRTKIEGQVTAKKCQKADRKKRHMSWQLQKQIPEFRPSLEQILTQVPMGGVQYSKMYYWDRGKRPKFEFIPMDDVYVPYHAADFYSASRKTHRQKLTKQQFEERINSELYVSVDLEHFDSKALDDESKPEKANNKIEGKEKNSYDEDGTREVFETYCWLSLEEDHHAQTDYKYAPYVMTIDEPTGKVIGLYRNWDPTLDEITFEELLWIVEWQFVPWRGAYAIGLPHLVGGLSASATGALRALMDSAHINNAPTLLKLKGAQISGQNLSIGITQVTEINGAPGIDDIKKLAMPVPFNPPSPVLFQLLGFLVETAKGVVRTALDNSPEMSPNTPVGTELSRVEQGLVVYSAIHARLHGSMEKVLSILHRLNKQHLVRSIQEVDPAELEEHSGDWDDELSIPLAFKEDYEGEIDVQPVSDPNIFSDHQRFAQLQSVGQLIQLYPNLYDVRSYNKRMLQLLKVPDYEEFLVEPPQMEDENPATENIKMAMNIPASVLPDQDHLAHLQVHLDFATDPMYGMNPVIQRRMAATWVEHVTQHILMLYGTEVKNMIEQASGQPIKELMGKEPEIKLAMSKAVAAASPLALQNTQALLEKVMPILQQFAQIAGANEPPAPMDPTQVAAQDSAARAAIAKEKNQIDQQKVQLKAVEDQQDAQLQREKLQVDLIKNREDNRTALEITGLRAISGKPVGNLRNGNGIDQNFQDGGYVSTSTGVGYEEGNEPA
jgi:hypothetical protein